METIAFHADFLEIFSESPVTFYSSQQINLC
jgi:hypothetical protein